MSEDHPADDVPQFEAGPGMDATAGLEWPAHLFKTAVEASGEAIVVTSSSLDFPGPQIEYVNPAFSQMTGYTAQEVIGRTPRLLQGPETNRQVMAEMRAALASGNSFQGEAINYRKDGTTYIVEWLITPVTDANNAISHWVSTQRNITQRKQSEEALRVSEERLRHIAEGVRDYAIFTTDAEDCVETWLPGAAIAYGWSSEEIRGKPAAVLFVPEDRANGVPEQELETARSAGGAPNNRWHQRKDGSRVFIEGSVAALFGPDGRVRGFLKVGQDCTERRAAEELQALLMLEVNHRAMNALAVVQAVLRLTPKMDVLTYSEAAQGRVAALARAQMLLTQARWRSIDLLTLLENELLPFTTELRVQLDGPSVLLPPATAQPIAMAIHELATNATKHGALSMAAGRVAVSWGWLDQPASRIWIRWVEADGPPVMSAPKQLSFGTQILKSTVCRQLGGNLNLSWATSGLICEMDVSIRQSETLG